MFYNKEDVHRQQSEADTRKDQHIYTFRSWSKTWRHCCTFTLTVHHDGIGRNTSNGMGEKWLKMIKLKRHSNSHQSSGRITSNTAKTFSHETLFKCFCMLYVDDGAFSLETRKYMEIGSNIVFKDFNHFGLQMHIRSKSKPSKKECVFPLPLVTLN